MGKLVARKSHNHTDPRKPLSLCSFHPDIRFGFYFEGRKMTRPTNLIYPKYVYTSFFYLEQAIS